MIWQRRKNLDIQWHRALELSLIEKIFLFVIFLIVLWLAGIALLAPPNTCDALSYHLSRVVHWIQNRGVAYYPTHILRELFYPPWAEYAIAQFQILSRGDQWANFVQWLSMIGSLAGVSLIAKELGAGRWGQILSVIVAATIPMGILQATSTQTDYSGALWLCAFIYFFIRWRKTFAWEHAFWMGMALGLAFLTKPTGIVFAVPFLLWMAGIMLRRFDLQSLGTLAIIVMVGIILNSGMFYRNAQLFSGRILDTGRFINNDSLINDHFGWQELAANAIRNTDMELATPWVGINKVVEGFFYRASKALHVDIHDRSSSYQGENFGSFLLSMNEDSAESPLDVILFIVAAFLVAIFPSLRNREIVFYLLALIGMFIAFNLIFKWQCWGMRFHLSLFVMAAPLIGAVFERMPSQAPAMMVMSGLLACALPYVFSNPMKAFVTAKNVMQKTDRRSGYFNNPGILPQYKIFKDRLEGMQCHQVGIILEEFGKEYPFWAVLNPSADSSIRFEHIEVDNFSSSLEYPIGKFDPCGLILVSHDYHYQVTKWGKNVYVRVFTYGQDNEEINTFVKVNN